MSKAVLISIRPKWCEKIARGEKTIEVRKTRPKLDTPFRCYIYRKKGFVPHIINGKWVKMEVGGTVIGEFTCERIVPITYDGGRLWCPTNAAFSPATCLSQAEIIAYIGDKGRCYGWHIANLKIYDTPRELSEFEHPYECNECDAKWATECNACHEEGKIKRPPQSWCYVEEG